MIGKVALVAALLGAALATDPNPTSPPVSAPTSPLPTKPPTKPYCDPRLQPIDVYFVVDASSSISGTSWENQNFFLSKMVEHALNIPGDRAGIIQWSNKAPRHEFNFGDTLADIMANVAGMSQLMGATKTSDAIIRALKSLKQDNERNPPTPADKNQVMMLITDGVPNPTKYNPCGTDSLSKDNLPQQIANTANLEFVIIGIGKNIDFSFLNCLVSDPTKNLVVLDDFKSFDQYRDPTSSDSMCVDPSVFTLPTPSPTYAECNANNNEYFSQTQEACVPCPAGEAWDEQNQKCYDACNGHCGRGTRCNPSNNECEADPDNPCAKFPCGNQLTTEQCNNAIDTAADTTCNLLQNACSSSGFAGCTDLKTKKKCKGNRQCKWQASVCRDK